MATHGAATLRRSNGVLLPRFYCRGPDNCRGGTSFVGDGLGDERTATNAAGVHHSPRRRGGRVAIRGARAAAGDAGEAVILQVGVRGGHTRPGHRHHPTVDLDPVPSGSRK
jgi:hypothetical protein